MIINGRSERKAIAIYVIKFDTINSNAPIPLIICLSNTYYRILFILSIININPGGAIKKKYIINA